MPPKPEQGRRCAIYTRKSTEHGLELEFNSLHAQREACAAYIKSQTHEGWRPLAQHYDDPAYSGGSLERPGLKQLLADIDAGKVDVVVVYKIDRLTRSLADFAKLVEIFDRKGISFVAVTQQFNTTTSMGRLTLNVLLSFAQFERELASERVRDKVAASRKKGKWTGGGSPLGYDIKNKKLVLNETEAKTIRYIFRRYLELGCLRRLSDDLAAKGITTKRRAAKGRAKGGITFTHGPLAYLLKNRTYLGEIGHNGTWYPAEHAALLDRGTFDAVQARLQSNSVQRRSTRSASGALLAGLLYDDRGNRMSPSYSTKNGVRHRYYVSAPLLRARKGEAGSVSRVSAHALETALLSAIRDRAPPAQTEMSDRDLIQHQVARIALAKGKVLITLTDPDETKRDGRRGTMPENDSIVLPWFPQAAPTVRLEGSADAVTADHAMVQAIARAHAWRIALASNSYDSIEDLAAAQSIHPKIVRQNIRLAFIAPDVTKAILRGEKPSSLSFSDLRATLPLSWDEQRRALGFQSFS